MHEGRQVPLTAVRSIVVAIPAYNEDRFIGSLVLKLRARDRRVLVIDDGSSDATADLAEAAGATVVRHEHNQGKMAAVQTAFEQARRMGADALVLLDGDSQHDPADVDGLVEPILSGDADKVVGVPIHVHYETPMKRNPVWHGVGQLDAIFRLIAEHRPLLFFGLPGLAL